MKNTLKLFGTIVITMMVSFTFAACPGPTRPQNGQNEIVPQRAPIVWLGESPVHPTGNIAEGSAYFNTIARHAYIFWGGEWRQMSQAGGQGLPGADGLSITWRGEYTQPNRPSNPRPNDLIHDPSSGNSYIFSGTVWVVMAAGGADGLSITWRGEYTYPSRPENSSLNDVIHDPSSGNSYIFNGMAWVLLVASGEDGGDGLSITWRGEYTYPDRPDNPNLNDFIHDPSSGNSYIFDGAKWLVFVAAGEDGEPGEVIPVTSIAISGAASVSAYEYSLFLPVGDRAILTATVSPSNALVQTVLWVSDNPTVNVVRVPSQARFSLATGSSVEVSVAAGAPGGTIATLTATALGSGTEEVVATIRVRTDGARTYEESVQRVVFAANTATLTFSNLRNNNIYLFRVNTSASAVSAANTGSVLNTPPNLTQASVQPLMSGVELPPRGHPAAREFSAKPPPIDRDRSALPALPSTFAPPVVGDTRLFWVETFMGSSVWIQRQANLLATGRYGNIWVVGNGLSTAQARRLSDHFDIIYPAATNILGYEYGGGPGGHGGMDGDPKVQILVYDILNASGNVAASGFFWAKDWFTQRELDTMGVNLRTNQAEIFYIDSSTARNSPDWTALTLAHELQHLINWNVKTVRHGVNSAAWYNEMLAQMTEDVIADLLGIFPTNNVHTIWRIQQFFLNRYHEAGFTEWFQDWPSYARVFAFGAFLLRNFGGAEILRSIHANNTTNIESITAALQEYAGVDFLYALRRFGEAMVFSGNSIPEGALTFDRTVTNTINGFTYTSHAFDIWEMGGPRIFGLTPMNMWPHSILLQSSNAWINRSGDISITLQRPSNSAIGLYLLVR